MTTFNKTYSEKETELKVPARIQSHPGGASTTYLFKSLENIRTHIDWENNTLEVIVRRKD